MEIRVEVDDHLDSSEELIFRVEGVVEGSLDRFKGRIARVEVHLGQMRQAGQRDMCCRMEAYAGVGPNPISVFHAAVTLTEAIHAASAKLERAVLVELGRRKTKKMSASESAASEEADPEEGLGQLRSS